MKKILTILSLLTLISAVVLTGCSSNKQISASPVATSASPATAQATPNSANAAQEKKVEINMLVKSAPEVPTFKKSAEMYMSKHPNVKITINELGRDGYMDRLKNQLFSKSPDIDIVNFTNNELGALSASGVIENLTPYMENSKLNDSGFKPDMFLESAKNAMTFDRNIYGFPYGASTILLYYRTDLIKNPPKTWDEYVETAKQFTKSINSNSPTEYGTTMQGKRGSVSPREFSAYLWSYGGDFKGDKINSEGSVEALNLWVKLYQDLKVVPPDITTYEYDQVLQAFQSGKTAMALQWSEAGGTFADKAQSPKIYDKFAAAVIPGKKQSDGSIKQVPYLQNWLFAINKFSKNKEEAYKFLSFYSHPDNYKEAMNEASTTALKDVLKSDNYKASRKIVYDAYSQSLQSGRAFPTEKYSDKIQNIVDLSISQALSKEKTPKEALDNAAKEIKSTGQ